MFLEISQNSLKNTCARACFLIKLQVSSLEPATFLKNRLWYRCFPVNFAKFLRTSFYRTPPGDCFCSFYSHFFLDIAINNCSRFLCTQESDSGQHKCTHFGLYQWRCSTGQWLLTMISTVLWRFVVSGGSASTLVPKMQSKKGS